MLFARLKIRTGLLLVLGIFSLALWGAVFIAWSGARSAAQATTALIELSDHRIQPLYDTERLFLSTLINMDNAYINLVKGDQVKSNDYTRKASAALQDAKKTFEAYRRGLPPQATGENVADARRVAQAYEAYTKVLGQREVALYDVSLDDYAAATVSAEAADREFAATLREVIRHAEAVRQELHLSSEQRYTTASYLAGAMFICSLLLVCLYWMLFDRVLLRPLQSAGRHFDRIAGGDLGVPGQGISDNEIGVLLAALDRMQQGLADTVSRIRDATATREQAEGIEQVSRTVVEMDRSTQQNAALVEQTSAAAEALTAQAGELAESVAVFRASNIMQRARIVARCG